MKKDKWINVDERQPKKGDWVLVYSEEGDNMNCMMYDGEKFYDPGHSRCFNITDPVSHWQPLPLTPFEARR